MNRLRPHALRSAGTPADILAGLTDNPSVISEQCRGSNRVSGWCRERALDRPPSGITLFEVVLALAIFLGAIAVIGQVLKNGGLAASKAQLTADAVLRCENRINQVLAGVLPLTSVQQAPFEDDAAWLYTINVVETSVLNLLEVQVVVEHYDRSGVANANFQLSHFLVDPQTYEDAAALEAEPL